MSRSVDPSKIVAFITLKNFSSYYEKNPWQPLARAIGIQRYDTVLMIMRTATALSNEAREQYDRLATIQKEMESLYRIWYQNGGIFSAKTLSDMEYMDVSFHDYKAVAKVVVRMSRLFRRKNIHQDAIVSALKQLGDSADQYLREIKNFYACRGLF